MEHRKPTLQDVAEYAGVSTATVSRSLNQPDKVKPDVYVTIMQAIRALGYVPHGAARALASRKTKTVGAVVPTIDNAIFAEAIQHLQAELSQAGYTLLLANSSYCLEEEHREVSVLLSRGIDGLVLVGEEHHPDVFEAIERRALPYVNLWIYNPESRYSCIGFDHQRAGLQIAEHLLALGHQHFAAISAIRLYNDRATQRLAGIRNGVLAQGIEWPDAQIFECRYSVEQGRLALHNLLERFPQTTAVVCGNDILALGALWAARERQIAVPEQLSITGFDNLEIIHALSPALTTVNAPSRRMGYYAADYLLRQFNATDSASHSIERLELDAELIVRETTAIALR